MSPGPAGVAVALLLGLGPAPAELTAAPAPSPTLVASSRVDAGDAVLLPVEDVVARTERLVFAEASVDGAVTDRGGRDFVLASDVVFAFNQATLTPRARTEIARIARVLTAPPGQGGEPEAQITTVTVTGFTDDVGSDRYNLALSRRRAAAVRSELVRELGSAVPVTAVGRGEQDPVATNDTKRGRQANRRVEIRGR